MIKVRKKRRVSFFHGKVMDVALLGLASLIGGANALNSTRERNPRALSVPSKTEVPNGTNIYNSADYYKISGEETARATKNWEAAKDPISSGVIPRYFNTLSIDFGTGKTRNENFDEGLIREVVGSLDEEAKMMIKKKGMSVINDWQRNPQWGVISGIPQTNAVMRMGLVGAGVEVGGTGGAGGAGGAGGEGVALSQIGGSLLPNRGHEDFSHNNLVPFYRGSLKQNMNIENRMNEGKLEVYTGQFKLNNERKREVGAFFRPEESAANIYGNHEVRDLSRIIPSNNGKKNNETPFEKIIVGPGLNSGFTATPSGGFHNLLRILPKRTEDTVVNPVFETEGRINHGKAHVQNRPLVAPVYVNRQKLIVENKEGERNLTTVGAVSGRRLRPQIIAKDTNRKDSKMIIGPAGATTSLRRKVDPSVRETRRMHLRHTTFRNANGKGRFKDSDYGKSSITNYTNNRSTTSRMHILNPQSLVQSIKSYFTDSAKRTRKQIYNKRKGNFSGGGRMKAYDPEKWRARTTIKETTHMSDYKGIGSGTKRHKVFNKDEIKAKTTKKETTLLESYLGALFGTEKRNKAYNKEDWRARTTRKQTTQMEGYLGGAITEGGNVVYDPEDWKARKTTKQTTQMECYLGGAITEGGNVVYDPEDWKARKTTKETTQMEGYLGGTNSGQNGQGYKSNVFEAKNTSRQFLSDNEYIGAANSKNKKMTSYEAGYSAQTNVVKEVISSGRGPTEVKNKLAAGIDKVSYDVRKLEGDRLNRRVQMKTASVMMAGPGEGPGEVNITTQRNYLKEEDTRLDPTIVSVLRNNPYAQSLTSFA